MRLPDKIGIRPILLTAIVACALLTAQSAFSVEKTNLDNRLPTEGTELFDKSKPRAPATDRSNATEYQAKQEPFPAAKGAAHPSGEKTSRQLKNTNADATAPRGEGFDPLSLQNAGLLALVGLGLLGGLFASFTLAPEIEWAKGDGSNQSGDPCSFDQALFALQARAVFSTVADTDAIRDHPRLWACASSEAFSQIRLAAFARTGRPHSLAVLSFDVQPLGTRREGDLLLVGTRFFGQAEGPCGEVVSFDETWTLSKDSPGDVGWRAALIPETSVLF